MVKKLSDGAVCVLLKQKQKKNRRDLRLVCSHSVSISAASSWACHSQPTVATGLVVDL